MTATAIWIFVIVVSMLFAWLFCWCKTLLEKYAEQSVEIETLRAELLMAKSDMDDLYRRADRARNDVKACIGAVNGGYRLKEYENEKQQVESRQKDS